MMPGKWSDRFRKTPARTTPITRAAVDAQEALRTMLERLEMIQWDMDADKHLEALEHDYRHPDSAVLRLCRLAKEKGHTGTSTP